MRYAILSLSICVGLMAQQNASQTWEAQTWETWLRRADQFDRASQFAEAAEAGKRALDAAKSFDPDDRRRAIIYLFIGNIYRDWRHCAESRANYAHSVAIWDRQPQPDSRYAFTALESLIGADVECGNLTAAEDLFRSHSAQLRRFSSGPLDDAAVLELQAGIAVGRRRYAEAEDPLRQAIAIAERTPGAGPARAAELRNLLSIILADRGRYEQALTEAQFAVAALEPIDPQPHSLAQSLDSEGRALFMLGRKKEAAQTYQRALDLSRTTFGEDNRITATIMVNYATVLKAIKKPREAEALLRQGQDTYRRLSLRDADTVDVQELGNANR